MTFTWSLTTQSGVNLFEKMLHQATLTLTLTWLRLLLCRLLLNPCLWLVDGDIVSSCINSQLPKVKASVSNLDLKTQHLLLRETPTFSFTKKNRHGGKFSIVFLFTIVSHNYVNPLDLARHQICHISIILKNWRSSTTYRQGAASTRYNDVVNMSSPKEFPYYHWWANDIVPPLIIDELNRPIHDRSS